MIRPIPPRLGPVFMLALLAGALAGAADKRREASPAKPAPSTPSTERGFEAFQLVVERNIFNPNRTGRTRAPTEEKAPRFDEISLVGTMEYEKGLIAFFDSSDAAFRKTVPEGGAIGEFKVQRILPNGVELLRDGQPLTLQVAQQLRRAEGGDWAVTETQPRTDTGANTSGSSGPRTESAPVEIPPDASEALKRLLKKREKQLK